MACLLSGLEQDLRFNEAREILHSLLKGKLQCKTTQKGVKEGAKTSISSLIFFRSASSSTTRAGEKKQQKKHTPKTFKITTTCSILQIVSGVH